VLQRNGTRRKIRRDEAELGFGGGSTSYRLSWAAVFIWDVDMAAADRATPSQPCSCLRRTTTSAAYSKRYGAGWVPDGLPSWAGSVGCGKVSVSLFFSTLFILFYFLFSVLLFLIQVCYFILQVLN
jgi:hypothetical protein